MSSQPLGVGMGRGEFYVLFFIFVGTLWALLMVQREGVQKNYFMKDTREDYKCVGLQREAMRREVLCVKC